MATQSFFLHDDKITPIVNLFKGLVKGLSHDLNEMEKAFRASSCACISTRKRPKQIRQDEIQVMEQRLETYEGYISYLNLLELYANKNGAFSGFSRTSELEEDIFTVYRKVRSAAEKAVKNK